MASNLFAIIMPWGRVGSNLVVTTMMNECGVKIANEPTTAIRSRLRSQGPEGFFAADLEQINYLSEFPSSAAKISLTHNREFQGMKISHQSLISPMMAYSILKERNFRIVSMVRKNHIKAAISQMRAEIRAGSMGSRGAWSVAANSEAPEATRIDPQQLIVKANRFLQNTVQMQQYLEHFFSDKLLTVTYEDLNKGPKEVISGIATHLGYQLPDGYTLPHRKATYDDLSLSVTNWSEVKGKVLKSKFHDLLDHD